MAHDRGALREAYLGKAAAELDALAEQGVRIAGNAFSNVTFAKGAPEDGGAVPFSAADGEALRKSLIALGYEPQDWNGFLTCQDDGSPLERTVFLQTIAALDPATLILCDEEAAGLARDAFADELSQLADFDAAMLAPGTVAHAHGIRMMNLGGFSSALSDNRKKQIMWARLKKLPPLGEPY